MFVSIESMFKGEQVRHHFNFNFATFFNYLWYAVGYYDQMVALQLLAARFFNLTDVK